MKLGLTRSQDRTFSAHPQLGSHRRPSLCVASTQSAMGLLRSAARTVTRCGGWYWRLFFGVPQKSKMAGFSRSSRWFPLIFIDVPKFKPSFAVIYRGNFPPGHLDFVVASTGSGPSGSGLPMLGCGLWAKCPPLLRLHPIHQVERGEPPWPTWVESSLHVKLEWLHYLLPDFGIKCKVCGIRKRGHIEIHWHQQHLFTYKIATHVIAHSSSPMTSAEIHLEISTYNYIHTYTITYIHIRIYIYTYMHAYVHTYIHRYIYIHTHIYTYRITGLGELNPY